jgi:hypothetical protein
LNFERKFRKQGKPIYRMRWERSAWQHEPEFQ